MPNVKGSAITARWAWVRETQGEPGLKRLRGELLPSTKAILEGNVLKSSWYPFEAFVDLTVCIDRLFGRGDLALARELGRYGAEANLKTIYRLFYKLGSVKWIIERAAAVWRTYYDSGYMVVKHGAGNTVDLVITEFATPHRSHCLSVLGWAEKSVEMSGGKLLTSEEATCRLRGDAVCTLRLTWE